MAPSHDPTDGRTDAVTADGLLVSDTVTGTVHAFREDEPRAVCGHRRTRRNFASVDVKPAPDAAWRAIECGNCQRALASRYRSVCDEWEAVRALEEDDVVRLHVGDGEHLAAVVTSAADDLEPGGLGTLYVRLTTEPGRVSYLRDVDDDYRLRVSEGDAPTLTNTDLLEELDSGENPEREVRAVEVVGTHDYRADEDPDQREALLHAAEQVAAMHDRMAEETGSSEEHLWNVNYSTALRDVAYRLRSDEWPVAWVRQKVESKADAYDGYPDEVRDDPEADRDDVAKAAGKAAGYEQALRLVEEYAPEGGQDDGQDDDAPEVRTDGGEDVGHLQRSLTGETRYSREFDAPVTVHNVYTPNDDEAERGVVPIDVELPDGTPETSDVHSLVREQADPDDLEPGDSFVLPTESRLVVLGVAPADEDPESARDGPLYEAELRSFDGGVDDEEPRRLLYGPHNIRQGLAGGAVYAGQVDVSDDVRPFWCDGCQFPHTHDDRRHDPLLDGEVCSYGCARQVAQEQAAARMADDDRK